jgi:hypothetical protein
MRSAPGGSLAPGARRAPGQGAAGPRRERQHGVAVARRRDFPRGAAGKPDARPGPHAAGTRPTRASAATSAQDVRARGLAQGEREGARRAARTRGAPPGRPAATRQA